MLRSRSITSFGRWPITLAQTPDDAEHAEMPRHAIAMARVDIVLPAADLPQRLLDLWSNARRIEQQSFEFTQSLHSVDRPTANVPERARIRHSDAPAGTHRP